MPASIALLRDTATSPLSDHTPQLARVLSPSQLNTWCDCQAKWWYRSGLKEPETRGSSLAVGSAVHKALAENFRQKIETKEDLPIEGLLAVYAGAWEEEAEACTWIAGEDAEDLRLGGGMLLAKYLDEVAPRIEPAAVDVQVSGAVGGVNVAGWVDLRDVDGRVIDFKTAAKKPSEIRADYRRQVATYSLIDPEASGAARLDTLVKTRTVQLVEQSFTVSDADRRSVEVLYPLAQEGMRSGLYMPNRNSFLCSRKYCSFWERCEADFGGEVGR